MPELEPTYFDAAITTLRQKGVLIAPGLTAPELEAVELEYGFRFPPDLRALLEHAVPVGERFPSWRSRESQLIREQLAWPADGICFDVEHNGFWLPTWGPKPSSIEKAQTRAREAVRAAPALIPIFGHRYLPASPCEAGNPVFSIYQTDIICYGFDLPSYLFAEFGIPNPFAVPRAPRGIALWSELERLDR